ncbi:hypothetical protein [Alloscardovia criceti]|uniref:hypothetical protein n=1 Tax=Alloscardovia criceti TaxID=356828 RepID=UPI0012E9A7AD|nr:hypothetical protein [Alloscardovia criceti]
MNQTRDHTMSKGQPVTPWAMYLAWEGTYQYIVFDLDNHEKNKDYQAIVDTNLADMMQLLDQQHIQYLVCSSSANGGYHIWIAMKDSLDAALVRHVAYTMSSLFESLDITPLTNPATGCVRPPYVAHHTKGASTPVQGNISTLLNPETTENQILDLLDAVTLLAQNQPHHARVESKNETEQRDSQGMPYLPGTPRTPSRHIDTLMRTPISAATDTSARLYAIVLGMVKNHWHYATLITYMHTHATLPGFTHAFSRKKAHTRIPRPEKGINSMPHVVARMWTKAYTTITNTTQQHTGTDTEFIQRRNHVTRVIDSVVARNMNTTLTGTGAATDQRVLNALCLFSLQANSLTIQADTRRIALTTGISRQSAAVSFTRLRNNNIISLTSPATGRQAHTYTIRENSQNTSLRTSQRQNPDTSEYAPQENTLPIIHTQLVHMLTRWLTTTSHDACTYHGLGILRGNTYATTHLDTPENTLNTQLDRIAYAYQCEGTVAIREATYTVERALWAWWCQELDHMTSPARHITGRPPAHTATSVHKLTLSQYPRKNNKAHYATARNMISRLIPIKTTA